MRKIVFVQYVLRKIRINYLDKSSDELHLAAIDAVESMGRLRERASSSSFLKLKTDKK